MQSHGVSRLEAFSDASFAFAVTLLVVSLEVPRSYQELEETLRGFPAFAICFALLIMIWFHHRRFFHRYPLGDGLTVFLNSLLLFVVLFYVYPLKFLFLFLTEALFGSSADLAERAREIDMTSLMTIYGIGFAAIFAIFILLHAHALRRGDALGLDDDARYDARSQMQHFSIYVGVALLSIVIIQVGGPPFLSGIVYGLLGPAAAIHGTWRARRAAPRG